MIKFVYICVDWNGCHLYVVKLVYTTFTIHFLYVESYFNNIRLSFPSTPMYYNRLKVKLEATMVN